MAEQNNDDGIMKELRDRLNALPKESKDNTIKKIACIEEIMGISETLLSLKEDSSNALALWINTGVIMMTKDKTITDMRTVIETISKDRMSDEQAKCFSGMLKKLMRFKEGKTDTLRAFGKQKYSTDFEMEVKRSDGKESTKEDLSPEDKIAFEYIDKKMKEMLSNKGLSKEEISVRVEMLSKEVKDKFGMDVEVSKIQMHANAGNPDITKAIEVLIDTIGKVHPGCVEKYGESVENDVEADTASLLSLIHLCRVMGGLKFMVNDIARSRKIYQWLQKTALSLNDQGERERMEKEMMEDPELDAKLKEELKSILNNKPNKN
jgi:hypothetical protein